MEDDSKPAGTGGMRGALSALLDGLWIEEKVVWVAALSTWTIFAVLDLPFSVHRVAGPYALFLGRIAAIVVLMVVAHRLLNRCLGKRSLEPFTVSDVSYFLRTLGFYLVALTTYTNIKTHTLLIHPRLFDRALETLDRWVFLGTSPTGLALQLGDRPLLTQILDAAYAHAWIPLAITFGIVFSQAGGEAFRRLARVISLNYLLGALLYVALPAVGPAFAERELYEHLRGSRSYLIQASLIHVHNQIVAAPKEFLVPAFMGIAAFPSLHVSHIYLPVLVAWNRARPLLLIFVPGFLLVAASTVYFGWHWLIDIPAGMATIHICFWLARQMERFERGAVARRAARTPRTGRIGEFFGRGLAQWPVPAALAGLHLGGLLAGFAVLAPEAAASWGALAATLFFLGFLALFEFFLLTLVVALLEGLAEGSSKRRLIDATKAAGLALALVLALASLAKLFLTSNPLGEVDLRFLTGNLAQLADEASMAEIGLAGALLALFVGSAFAFYRGFRISRQRVDPLPTRSFLLLGTLALLGAVYPYFRYPEVRMIGARIAPEVGWLLVERGPQLPSGAEAPREPLLLGPPIRPYDPALPAERPNVLLIMLESVPGAMLDTPEAAAAMPNLLALGRQAVRFERPYAPSVHSDYAQMAILSSLHPRKYPHHDYYERLDYPRTLLWDVLEPAGWRTGMFSCQNENWGNMATYLRTPGLEVMRHSPDWPLAPHKGRGTESKVFEPTVVGAWQEWLDTLGDEPWMAYLNFQATHFPYEIPAGAPRPFQPDEIDFPAGFLGYPREKIGVIWNRYLNALAYTDRYVGEAIRILREREELDETWLVVVSDHGEAFYEHGQPTHGTALYEEQVRSLLLVRPPGGESRTVAEPVGLLDLAPSLIAELGLPQHGNFQGAGDIFDPGYSSAGRPFYFTIQGMTMEDGILLDDWKYVVNWVTRSESLYDLSRDPGESRNLAEIDVERRYRVGELLEGFLRNQLGYYAREEWNGGFYPPSLR